MLQHFIPNVMEGFARSYGGGLGGGSGRSGGLLHEVVLLHHLHVLIDGLQIGMLLLLLLLMAFALDFDGIFRTGGGEGSLRMGRIGRRRRRKCSASAECGTRGRRGAAGVEKRRPWMRRRAIEGSGGGGGQIKDGRRISGMTHARGRRLAGKRMRGRRRRRQVRRNGGRSSRIRKTGRKGSVGVWLSRADRRRRSRSVRHPTCPSVWGRGSTAAMRGRPHGGRGGLHDAVDAKG